jgi:hypothetical protein
MDLNEQLIKVANNYQDTDIRTLALKAMYRIEELERQLEAIREKVAELSAVLT